MFGQSGMFGNHQWSGLPKRGAGGAAVTAAAPGGIGQPMRRPAAQGQAQAQAAQGAAPSGGQSLISNVLAGPSGYQPGGGGQGDPRIAALANRPAGQMGADGRMSYGRLERGADGAMQWHMPSPQQLAFQRTPGQGSGLQQFQQQYGSPQSNPGAWGYGTTGVAPPPPGMPAGPGLGTPGSGTSPGAAPVGAPGGKFGGPGPGAGGGNGAFTPESGWGGGLPPGYQQPQQQGGKGGQQQQAPQGGQEQQGQQGQQGQQQPTLGFEQGQQGTGYNVAGQQGGPWQGWNTGQQQGPWNSPFPPPPGFMR